MFDRILETIPADPDLPVRSFGITVMKKVLDGTFYSGLEYEFHEEKNEDAAPGEEYIPLRDRKPCVRYNLAKIVVHDTVSLLFSEGHFPTVHVEAAAKAKAADDGADETAADQLESTIADLVKETKLNETMIDAATKGSVGSIALRMRISKRGRPFFFVHTTEFLTPAYDPDEPDTLVNVTEQYKVVGADLKAKGYAIDDDKLKSMFWFARVWDKAREIWYLPWRVGWKTGDSDTAPWVEDDKRTYLHDLEFVPLVWIKNLPGCTPMLGDVDGACTFWDAIDFGIEIDYQLSQNGRGLKYSSDPTLLIKESPSEEDGGAFVRGGGSILSVEKDGDARMLEINGTASEAVIKYCDKLRELGLEAAHGSRASPDKMATAQSGRALELLNQPLIWVADRLRVSYGEGGLLSLINMVVRASAKYDLLIKGATYEKGALPVDMPLTLKWPAWYSPTADDRQQNATALKTHRDAGTISRETAVKSIAADFDIEDVDAELARIEKDNDAEDKRAAQKAKDLAAANPKPQPGAAA